MKILKRVRIDELGNITLEDGTVVERYKIIGMPFDFEIQGSDEPTKKQVNTELNLKMSDEPYCFGKINAVALSIDWFHISELRRYFGIFLQI